MEGMTPETFRKLLGIHGSDLRHWPEALQPEAAALLAKSRELRILIDQGDRLSQALRGAGLRIDLSDSRLRDLIRKAAREIGDLTREPGSDQAKRPKTGG
jgi:hypothetical protein